VTAPLDLAAVKARMAEAAAFGEEGHEGEYRARIDVPALVAEVERLAAEAAKPCPVCDAAHRLTLSGDQSDAESLIKAAIVNERKAKESAEAERDRLAAENARMRAVREAAQAGPFPPWISDDVNEFGERECFGCQRHGVEGEHSPRCRFGPIAAALRAAGGG